MLEENCGGLEGFCSHLYCLKQIIYSQYSFASHLKSVGGNTSSFPMCCLFRQHSSGLLFFSYVNEQLQAQEVPFLGCGAYCKSKKRVT